MTNRLPFAYLSKEVDRLYEKQFDYNDIKGIEAHCEFIVAYIRANGWTETDYTRAIMGVELENNGAN